MAKRGNEQELQGELWMAYYRAIDLIKVNLTWFVLALPVITLFPAIGGLVYATNQMANTGSASWDAVWEGFKRHFWLSVRWGLMNIVAFAVLGSNFWFYSNVKTPWLLWLRFPMAFLLVLWSVLQILALPLLLEQEDQRLKVALRNSAVLLLRKPLSVVGTVLLIAVIAVPSMYLLPPAWLFISASLCAFFASRTVVRATQELKANA